MKRLLIAVALLVSVLSLVAIPADTAYGQDESTLSLMCQQSGGAWNSDESRCDYAAEGGDCNKGFLGLPPWYKYLTVVPDASGGCSVVGPPGTTTDNAEVDWIGAGGLIVLAVVEALLQIAALVAVGFVIYGGFNYITTQGDPEKAKNARSRIINALVGLVITLAASGAVRFAGALLT